MVSIFGIQSGRPIHSQDWRPTLVGMFFAFMMLLQVIAEGSQELIQISSLLVFLVLFLVVISYPKTNPVPLPVLFLFYVFIILLILSNFIAINVIGVNNFTRLLAIIGYLVIGLLFASRLSHSIIEKSLPAYSIGLSIVLAYVLYDNDRIFARLAGHLHPNLWGFVVATSIPFVVFSKIRLSLKIIISAFFLYLLAFEFQTRAALSWVIFSFLVFVPIQFVGSTTRSHTKHFRIVGVMILLAAIAILLSANFEFVRGVFHLDSTTRGIGSGLSGRTTLWAEALRVFQERPIFGHGFDSGRFFASNFFQVYVAGEIESLHNSYLTMFFDMGLIGGALYIVIVGLSLSGAIAMRNLMLISFLTVYLGMGITDSRPLNVANPPGVLFVILLPYLASVFFSRRTKRKGTKQR